MAVDENKMKFDELFTSNGRIDEAACTACRSVQSPHFVAAREHQRTKGLRQALCAALTAVEVVAI